MKHIIIFACIVAILSTQCASPATKIDSNQEPKPFLTNLPITAGFNDYWYQGKAELSTYEVIQERYGESRPAEQVNVFVTEDFSQQKQVKLDDPSQAGTDRVPVLKLNTLRRFETGIYDYSIMQSIFTPVNGSKTLKTTATVQDWCGQVFFQTNLTDNAYRLRGYSYFESEGDTDTRLETVLLEDEIWTKLRINPDQVPTGQVRLIPSAIYSRIRHQVLAVQTAEIILNKTDKESTLTITYAAIQRTLQIRFESAFPHRILGWEETNKGKLASKGTLKALRMEPYWSQNSNQFSSLRDSLGLQ